MGIWNDRKLIVNCLPLTESERAPLEARLALARELIGPTDPMPHFRVWRAPAERYTPRHFEEEE